MMNNVLIEIQREMFLLKGIRTDVHYSEGKGALVVPEGAALTPQNVIMVVPDVELKLRAFVSQCPVDSNCEVKEISMGEKCEYCTGRPLVDRKPLMSSQTSDYSVFINDCNYLEDSVIGGSVSH